MPVLDITVVGAPDDPALASRLAGAADRVLRAERTRVRLQAKRCLVNIERALFGLGASLDHVVRTRMFVIDITGDWQAIGRAHAEVLGHVRPATTMVEVEALIEPWMLVEIEADAFLG
jgi:enamine deaminase RidA (YjgF/YER057c/UK114 family)